MIHPMLIGVLVITVSLSLSVFSKYEQPALEPQVLLNNTHIWDGMSEAITKKINILLENNIIKKMSAVETDVHAKASDY